MSRLLPALALLLVFAGCAAPPPTAFPLPSSGNATYIAAQKSDATKLRENISQARARRSDVKLQSEIDALEEEIRALEERLAEVEKRIAAAEGTQYVPAAASSGSGTVYTGPRGGRYTISPSGNKVYQKRR